MSFPNIAVCFAFIPLLSFGPNSHPVLRSFLWFTWMNMFGYQLQIAHIKITSSPNSQTKFTSSQLRDVFPWSPSLYDPVWVPWAIEFNKRRRSRHVLPLGLWPMHMTGTGHNAFTAYNPGPVSENLSCLVQSIIPTPSGKCMKMSWAHGVEADGWVDSMTQEEQGIPQGGGSCSHRPGRSTSCQQLDTRERATCN